MKILEIVNIERKTVGRISCNQPTELKLEVLDSSYESDLKKFVEKAKNKGFNHRTGRRVEQAGHTLIVDEQVTVKLGDEKFLEAMADNLSHYTFGGQRVFGLIKEQSEKVP